MTIFDLKIIACISMFLDHVKYSIPATSNFLTLYLGRLAFPLFCFVAVQGYLHTSDFKKYLQRLTVFGLISQIPYMLFLRTFTTEFKINVIFTILFGLLAIFCIDKVHNKFLGILGCLFIIVANFFIPVDYHWFGVLLILLIFLTRNKKFIFSISYILLVVVYFFVDYIKYDFNLILYYLPFILCTIFPLVFMLIYNGRLGYKSHKLKYFYYWFYPVHLLILYVISLFVQ